MKTKRTLIISSLIMGLALIVAAVSVTAAWFGDVTSQKLDANLTIDSGTVASSARVELTSDLAGEIFPAVANKGAYPAGSVPPGNYGDESVDKDALYPNKDGYNSETLKLAKDAQVGVLYFSINYYGAQDEDMADGRKTLFLTLSSVHLTSDYTNVDDKPQLNDGAIDFKNEFNTRMTLVREANNPEASNELTSADSMGPLEGDQIYYSCAFTEVNPYGHTFTMRVLPGTYIVKFEIYFNKIDEECDIALLSTQLTLTVELTQAQGGGV